MAKLHILDFYDLNDMDTSSRKAQVEYLLKHDRFICQAYKAEVWANLYIIYLYLLGNYLSSTLSFAPSLPPIPVAFKNFSSGATAFSSPSRLTNPLLSTWGCH